jgi:sugar O-acyltransferase (sialic acid O-acetyltransferase NeuD family)
VLTERVGILGAGRQALETSGYCKELGVAVEFFIEEKPPGYDRDPTEYCAPILPFADGFRQFGEIPVVSAIGAPDLRQKFLERWEGNRFLSVVSARSWVADDATLGVGCTLAPFAALNRRVVVGEHVLVNVGAILSHDVVVGALSTLSPGCTIGGGTRIGAGVFVGVGATIIDHIVVGDGAHIAAGAVVVSDITDGDSVMGVPAKPRSSSGS